MSSSVLILMSLILMICDGDGVLYSHIYKASQNNNTNEQFPSKVITEKVINRTSTFVRNIFERMATREEILGYAQVKIEEGTPSQKLFIDSYPEPEALEMMLPTLEAVAASAQIRYEYCLSSLPNNAKCLDDLKLVKLWDTPLKEACRSLKKTCTKEQSLSKYRTLDGSCNDYQKGTLGQSFTAYSRLLPPGYLGGIRDYRRSVTKQALPSARLISSNLVLKTSPDIKLSLAALFWGRFVEHDLSHTAMSAMVHTKDPIQCCDQEGRSFLPRYEHPFCMPIIVPTTDKYYGAKEVTCLSYVKSIPAIGPECSLGPMQQMNQATHFLDGSQIYGITKSRSDQLRNSSTGLLAPLDCEQWTSNGTCFVAGGKRINSDPHMNAMYSIWIKEHNRIASYLSKLNPIWDSEEVFQEARRIVIAEMQHITYNEWIPAVLGTKIDDHNNNSMEPTVSNEFATAAIRALHSGLLERLSLAEEEMKFKNQTKKFNIIEDMIDQKYEGRRLYYIGKSKKSMIYGYDILSLDIQRGRDHGLATYLEYRTYCGLQKINNFEDLEPFTLPGAVGALRKTYERVEDIDLIVGGLAEKPKQGLFGPTISCILREQLERTRASDRYFYNNSKQPVPFSESQIKEINKTTFARIICDNSDIITKIQRRIFESIGESNPKEDCEKIPKLDLGLWGVESFKYYKYL